MHIGIITGEFPPMEGGVGDYTLELSTALTHLGQTIDILTSYNNCQRIPRQDSLKVQYTIKNWSMTGSFPKIQKWLRTISPDIVNIQYQAAAYQMRGAINFLPKWLSLFDGRKIIVTYHDLLPPYLFPKAGHLRDRSVHFLARNANGIIVTNEEDKRKLLISLGNENPPVQVIPIGSNIAAQPPDDFNAAVWRMQHHITEKDLVIGFFGFMNRSKGVDILVSAVEQLYHNGLPVKLLFIGGRTGTSDNTNADYAAYIDAMINEKRMHNIVIKTGFVTTKEVSAALLAVDIVALPYLEGASFRHGTLHAALAHGCTIITTRPVQTNPKLENGSVFIIPPNDTNSLVGAVQVLWRDPALRNEFHEKALKLSASFGWDYIAKETAAFFSQCLDQT